MAIDRQIRDWFGIPVSSDAVEGAVVHQHIKNFAAQIANRVALLEPVPWRGANKSAVLCVDALEHHAKSQYVHQELIANEHCEVDCECMAVLARLARHGINSNEQWRALATPQMRKPLTDLLQSPPPELLQTLRSVAQDMGFGTLRDVIGNANEAGRLATQAGINEWRSSINVEALCWLFEQATKKIEKWERPAGYFVETISRLPRATSEATRAQLRRRPMQQRHLRWPMRRRCGRPRSLKLRRRRQRQRRRDPPSEGTPLRSRPARCRRLTAFSQRCALFSARQRS